MNFKLFRRGSILLGLVLCPGVGLLFAQSVPATTPSSPPPTQPANVPAAPVTGVPAAQAFGVPATAVVRTPSNVPSTFTIGQTSQSYVVCAGDTLDISVYDAPDLSVKSVVTDRGEVYLPLVKRVHVAGLTVEKVQAQIESALQSGGFMNDPLVRVIVTDYAHGVDMLGEVARPGTYPVAGSKRLLQLLTEAGGTTASAGPEITIRRSPDGRLENIALSSDPTDLLTADTWVNQGDIVIVPKAGVVYVVGEVLSPSGYAMQDRTDYTILKVVAMSHGTTKLAKLSGVKIIRKGPTGLTEVPVALDKVEALKAPDIVLKPDDIVFVPSSRGKAAAYRSAELAVSLASAAAVIGITRF